MYNNYLTSSLNFNGKNSYDDYDIIVESKKRILVPSKRSTRIDIAGRSGSIDTSQSRVYNDIIIACVCTCVSDDIYKIRTLERQIALWLSQKGELEFMDEAGVFYQAEVINEISLENIVIAGKFTIEFLCNPFAYKAPVTLPITSGNNLIRYQGTASTPTLIIIKNLSNQMAQTITISARKRVK